MKIRTVALAVIKRNEDQILVHEFRFPGHPVTFYRPIGGTVEFGENSKSTLIRELKEELNQDVEDPSLIAVIENIFGTEDDMGHEIDFIYEATFKDHSQYLLEEVPAIEGEERFVARWVPIQFFIDADEDVQLVPDGLLGLLTNQDQENQQGITHVKTRGIHK